MAKDDEVLTTRQACRFLKTTKVTLLKMVHKGTIPSAKVGNAYRFLKSELEDFLRGKTKDSQKNSRENG